jgi:hypothetical protein
LGARFPSRETGKLDRSVRGGVMRSCRVGERIRGVIDGVSVAVMRHKALGAAYARCQGCISQRVECDGHGGQCHRWFLRVITGPENARGHKALCRRCLIEELQREIGQILRTFPGLRTPRMSRPAPRSRRRGRRTMSAAARRAIGLAQKKRWAEWRKKNGKSN